MNEELGKNDTVKLEIELPRAFYDILDRVCKLKADTLNEYIKMQLVASLDCDMETTLVNFFEFDDHDFTDQLEALAFPEKGATV